jgi:hypothetical protein
MPRTDLSVTVKGVPVKPGFALGSYAAFKQVGDRALLMGAHPSTCPAVGSVKPVARGLRPLPQSATICRVLFSNYSIVRERSDTRSKFNVPLGIEAQGFCVLR